MQTPSTKASILKPIHSRRRRTPGTICLCVIDPATCPQCTRPAEAQSPRAEALQTRSVTFAPAVQICYFQEHETPRGVADDDRIATDTPRLTEVSPSDARESMVHDDCSIARKSSEPTKAPAEPLASPNQGTEFGKSVAALVYAHPQQFRGSATALAIARDRALVTYTEATDSRLPTRQLSPLEKRALATLDANGFSDLGGADVPHLRPAARFLLAPGVPAPRAGDVLVTGPFTPLISAMTGLLRALAEVRGQAYTARQRATWEGIRRQLGMGLREVVVQRGRLVGAAELRQGLVERVEGVLGEDAGLMGRTVGARRLHCDFRTLVEWVVEVAGVAMEEREGVVGRGGA